MSRVIFHIPFEVDFAHPSGSQLRPVNLIRAFKKLGHEVHEVSGHANARSASIREIGEMIRSGVRFDYVYSESSTMPTLLTEPHHLPVRPFLDFGFLKLCRNYGVPVGLFYRDIHWDFPHYAKIHPLKYLMARAFYFYDLLKYKQLVTHLFLPSLKMREHIPFDFDKEIHALPPGSEIKELSSRKSEKLRLLYIGGISELYDLTLLVETVAKHPSCELTICTRENEWSKYKDLYQSASAENIHVVHKSGEELLPLAENADIGVLFVRPDDYWKFVMPLKLFEYLSAGLPILSTSDIEVATYLDNHSLGWSCSHNANELTSLIKKLLADPSQLEAMKENVAAKQDLFTWESRVQKIDQILKG